MDAAAAAQLAVPRRANQAQQLLKCVFAHSSLQWPPRTLSCSLSCCSCSSICACVALRCSVSCCSAAVMPLTCACSCALACFSSCTSALRACAQVRRAASEGLRTAALSSGSSVRANKPLSGPAGCCKPMSLSLVLQGAAPAWMLSTWPCMHTQTSSVHMHRQVGNRLVRGPHRIGGGGLVGDLIGALCTTASAKHFHACTCSSDGKQVRMLSLLTASMRALGMRHRHGCASRVGGAT